LPIFGLQPQIMTGVLQNGCWAYFGKEKIGKRIPLSICPVPVAPEGSLWQHGGFFSEIRFPIFSFPNP
jgi:hypothetical protein